MGCTDDYCRIRDTNGIMKFTQKGIEELINILEKNNFADLHEVESLMDITEIREGFMFDIDTKKDLNKVRKEQLWKSLF